MRTNNLDVSLNEVSSEVYHARNRLRQTVILAPDIHKRRSRENAVQSYFASMKHSKFKVCFRTAHKQLVAINLSS